MAGAPPFLGSFATIWVVSASTPDLPDAVRAFADRGPEWAAFADRLPGLLRDLIARWQLVVTGPSLHGYCSLVVPVDSDGEPAMLKLGFPDEESEHEALGLQQWAGAGAVRLIRADPRHQALLLERLHPEDLTSIDVPEACELVARLYGRLHVPAHGRMRALTHYVERWTEDLRGLPPGAPVPHRLVQQAVSLGQDFLADPASVGTLIHTDLHYENVLAADREPWLVIDPKPVSGDPHYEVAPMLWNRWDEVIASDDVRREVRQRFHALVDVAGLDEDRARDWVVVRMVHNALWEIQDHPSAPDADYLTMCVAIAKAVQD